MGRYIKLSFAALLTLVLVSWGYDGHHAVGFIAQRHLTDKATQAVKQTIGETLDAVSTYADDIKSEGAFKYTAPFHFLDLPGGYNFDQFRDFVKNSHGENVYTGIAASLRDLQNPDKSRTQKAFALKMLVHLVGDAHQPMHIGHTEDRGGNKVQVNFFNQTTDLHSLWDEGMISRESLKYKDFALKCDNATPEQIKKWQSDDVIVWLWESYQISTILYQEAETDPKFAQDYYNQHEPILRARVEKAGIRLAGMLNEVYK